MLRLNLTIYCMPRKLRELLDILRIIRIFIESVLISNCYYKFSTQPWVDFVFSMTLFSWTDYGIFFAAFEDNLQRFALLRVLISLNFNFVFS